MTDKFVVSTNEIGDIIVTDVETDRVYRYGDISKFFGLIRLLNEQQATIQRMKYSLNTIYRAFEKHYGYDMRNAVWLIDELSYDEIVDELYIAETDSKNRKEASMYWKKKVDEQQATISKLEEEKGYWESKAMTLLMQVRRLTPRMSDKEVIEFGKELEDE